MKDRSYHYFDLTQPEPESERDSLLRCVCEGLLYVFVVGAVWMLGVGLFG